MARKTTDNDCELEYKDKHNHWMAYVYITKSIFGKINIDSNRGHRVNLSPAQARHIAKKLIQFADDIEKEQIT